MPETHLFFPYLHKRISYEHEKELRAIIMKLPSKNGAIDINAEPFEFGLQVPVDLEILIDKIIVCPSAPKWIFELTEDVCKKYAIDKEVIQSDLDTTPFI